MSRGLGDVYKRQPLLYPIPFTNELNILTKNNQNYNLELYSLDGKLILEIPLANNKTTIKVSELSTGLYFAKIMDRNNSIIATKKIVKN